MPKLFFLISGEYESLSFGELKAILEAEGCGYILVEKLDQTVRLEADTSSVEQIQRRSAYTRVCALELFTSEANDEAMIQAAEKTDFQAVLNVKQFVVRSKLAIN